MMKKSMLLDMLLKDRVDFERLEFLKKELRKAPRTATLGIEVEMIVTDDAGYIGFPGSGVVGSFLYEIVGEDGAGQIMELRLPPFPLSKLLTDEVLLSFIGAMRRGVEASVMEEMEPRNDYWNFDTACGTHIHLGDGTVRWIFGRKDYDGFWRIFEELAWKTKDVNGDRSEYSDYGYVDDYRLQPWGYEYRGCEAIYYSSVAFALLLYNIAESIIAAKRNEKPKLVKFPSTSETRTIRSFKFKISGVEREESRFLSSSFSPSRESDADYKLVKKLGFPWSKGYFKVIMERIIVFGNREHPRGLALYYREGHLVKLISYSGSFGEMVEDVTRAIGSSSVPVLLVGEEVKRKFAKKIGGIFGVVGRHSLSSVRAVFVPP